MDSIAYTISDGGDYICIKEAVESNRIVMNTHWDGVHPAYIFS